MDEFQQQLMLHTLNTDPDSIELFLLHYYAVEISKLANSDYHTYEPYKDIIRTSLMSVTRTTNDINILMKTFPLVRPNQG